MLLVGAACPLCGWASFFNFCSAASKDVIELITVEKLSKAIKLTMMEKMPWLSLQKVLWITVANRKP